MKYDGTNGIEVIEAHKRWYAEELDDSGVVRDDLRADFSGADLRGALMPDQLLYGAIFRGTNLGGADLTKCDLCRADLTGANLHYTRIEGANLHGAIGLQFIPIGCPDTGSFIAWKAAYLKGTEDRVILKLLIPEDAYRTSDTRRECRASKVKVLEIQAIDGTVLIDEHTQTDDCAVSIKHPEVEYRVGQITEAKPGYMEPMQRFEDTRYFHHNNGIFFFVNRMDAVLYLTGGQDEAGQAIDIHPMLEKYQQEMKRKAEERRKAHEREMDSGYQPVERDSGLCEGEEAARRGDPAEQLRKQQG